MKTLRDSVNAFALLLMVTAAAAIIMPLVSRGQGESQNVPPHRTLRKFYVTPTFHVGNEALTACAQGYHMASLWEIFDTSNLRYDTERGLTVEDSGFGPPSALGWIRTGALVPSQDIAGRANCKAWTSSDGTEKGTIVGLEPVWRDPSITPTVVSPWQAIPEFCDSTRRVWCVQD